MPKLKLNIQGMHCESCSKMIQMELEGKVNKTLIDYKKGNAEIDFDEDKISQREIENIINKLGYNIK